MRDASFFPMSVRKLVDFCHWTELTGANMQTAIDLPETFENGYV